MVTGVLRRRRRPALRISALPSLLFLICLATSLGTSSTHAQQPVLGIAPEQIEQVLKNLGAAPTSSLMKESWAKSLTAGDSSTESLIFALPKADAPQLNEKLFLKKPVFGGGFERVPVSPLPRLDLDGITVLEVGIPSGWKLETRNYTPVPIGQSGRRPGSGPPPGARYKRVDKDAPVVVTDDQALRGKARGDGYRTGDGVSAAARLRNVKATVTIFYRTSAGNEVCNGLHVAPGKILTARHCTEGTGHEAHFGGFAAYADAVNKASLLQLKINMAFTNNPKLGQYDIAIFDIVAGLEPVRSFVIPAVDSYARDLKDGENLDLVRRIDDDVWYGYMGISENKPCVLMPPQPKCPYGSVGHGCNSSKGSSGAPVFRRNTSEFVGVHVSSNGAVNCVIPLSVFISELRQVSAL